MGIGLSDEKSGKLIFNLGIAEIDKEAGRLVINVRYPVTCSEEEVYGGMEELLTRYEIGLIKEDHKPPVYFDADSGLAKTLLNVYQKHTGDSDSKPLVIGGGTYARAARGIIAYGAIFPGDEDRMHQRDEYIEISRLIQMTKIYAEAIYKLSSEEYNV